MLKNKKILLCVSGSIAIYKALELVRLLIKQRADVKVLMSEGAKRFIAPLTFEALCGNEVLHEKSESWTNGNNHIKITQDKDIVLIAPATANTINKIAHGIADTLLTQTILANTKPLLLAPAANTNMYNHEATQNALSMLKKRGATIIEPISKLLACLDEGKGALAEVGTIFHFTCKALMRDDFWVDKNVVITGGGTYEAIDKVRYIGNFSSGKMAEALAYGFFLKGANVTLLSSAKEFDENLPIQREVFKNSKELKEKLALHVKGANYLFMAAAVSDYVPKTFHDTKLKKRDIGLRWSLELEQNSDILSSVCKDKIKCIGFKAELDEKVAFKNAKNMLENKKLDAVCLNILQDGVRFGGDKNRVTFICRKGEKELKLDTKLNISLQIIELSKSL